MSSSGGTRAVLAALVANLGIAVTKFLAFGLTMSSSMLAEAIHSVADSGNQVLLLVGGRRSRRQADEAHPFGYGRERYVYGFIVAVVLFSVGGLFALYEGYHKVMHPEPITSWQWVPIAVLVIGIVLEGNSFRTALRESRPARRGLSYPAYIRRAKDPELPVVLLEDTAALLGLVFALLGVVLTLATGSGVWDGVGTLAIGALLVAVAVVLAVETKSLLVGEGADPAQQRAVEAAITAGDEVDRVIHLRTLHLGPDELLVAAKIAVRHGDTAAEIARGIDAAETRIRAAVPIATLIYLEPDLDRSRKVSPDGTA
jgi:cation diffusion facilitator family transporter